MSGLSDISKGMTSTHADWLTKKEVAQALEISEKSVERWEGRGKLQKAWRKVDGKRPVAVYHPEDVGKLKDSLTATEAFPVPRDDQQNNTKALVKIRGLPGEVVLGALSEALGQHQPRVAEKFYLTLAEACQLSGLSRTFILRAIKEGQLQGIKDGGWKIRRADLAKL